jgi:hypothetical protein
MTRRPRAGLSLGALLVVVAVLAGACQASATPPPSPGVTSAPSPAASGLPSGDPTGAPRPTPVPAPSGVLLLPTTFAVALEPGTYWSSPPFDLGFAFEIPEPGWVSGHLNAEFTDIQQHEGEPVAGVLPERIIGFGHPRQIHGTAIVDASGLTPAEAVDLWVERTDIETANQVQLELLGGDAVRVDVHAPVPMLPLFGGDDGTFRLDDALDVRIVVIAVEDGLFLATVHAPAADLEAAWDQALPTLESIDLDP